MRVWEHGSRGSGILRWICVAKCSSFGPSGRNNSSGNKNDDIKPPAYTEKLDLIMNRGESVTERSAVKAVLGIYCLGTLPLLLPILLPYYYCYPGVGTTTAADQQKGRLPACQQLECSGGSSSLCCICCTLIPLQARMTVPIKMRLD